jgi:hypothetical protein
VIEAGGRELLLEDLDGRRIADDVVPPGGAGARCFVVQFGWYRRRWGMWRRGLWPEQINEGIADERANPLVRWFRRRRRARCRLRPREVIEPLPGEDFPRLWGCSMWPPFGGEMKVCC